MNQHVFKCLKKYLMRYGGWLVGMVILSAGSVLLNFLYPLLLSQMIHQVETHLYSSISVQVVILWVVLSGKSLAQTVWQEMLLRFSRYFNIREYKEMYCQLFKVRYEEIKKQNPTYYISRIDTYLSSILGLLGNSLPDLMVSIISITISLVLAASIHPVLMLTLWIVLPFQVISYHWINKKLALYSQELQEVSSQGHSGIIDIVQNIESIKQLNDPNCFAELIGQKVAKTQACMYQVNRFGNLASSFSDYLIELLNGFALFYAIYLCYEQQISLSQLFLFYQVRAIYGEEIRKIVRMNIHLRDLKPAVSFVEENIWGKAEVSTGIDLKKIDHVSVDVQAFGFSEEKNILENILFDISPCQHIGLAADSGKGKSTLMKLIARFYENDQIFINDKPVNQFSYHSLREKIYLLSQNPELFPGTIRENLLYGLEPSAANQLDELCQYRFFQPILQMQDGLETNIWEHAANLSGGQKQIVTLARLLMHSPDFIIFDESFASIDAKTEQLFFEDVQDYLSNKMVIIISHRPSSLRYCQKIISL